MQELVDLLPWGVAFSLLMAGVNLVSGVAEAMTPRERETRLLPTLQVAELSAYEGPVGPAMAAIFAHGIHPRQVVALQVFRSADTGAYGPDALPHSVCTLVRSLWRDGAARGTQICEFLHGGTLPTGQCLWFVQVASTTGDVALTFVGPDRGASDHA